MFYALTCTWYLANQYFSSCHMGQLRLSNGSGNSPLAMSLIVPTLPHPGAPPPILLSVVFILKEHQYITLLVLCAAFSYSS